MNELEATSTPKTISPLSHDVDGRFSRKGKITNEPIKRINILNNIIISLYCALLLATDFILFAGSGNIELFRDSILPIPEVSYILLGFLVISFALVFSCRSLNILKSLLSGLVTYFIITIIFSQFSTINNSLHIGDFSIQYSYILAIMGSFFCFFIMNQENIFKKVLLLIAVFVMFMQVYIAYMQHKRNSEFLEIHNSQKQEFTEETDNQRIIYFMLPNMTSLVNLSKIGTPEAIKTRNLMLGFYKKNNFIYYPKAYTPEENYYDNMIVTLNPTTKSSPSEHIMKTRLLSEYWRFYNLKHERILLKDNQLYDMFKTDNFKISAYKSRDFDMCHKQHQINVDRCIEKINKPANIYDMDLSQISKSNILLLEWLAGMQIFKDISLLYETLFHFMNIDKLPMVGINYNNLYVMNSVRTFDILKEHIKQDKGKQSYFVFMDMPSNMYIYDEYCQIKPTDEWIDMVNMPWIKKDSTNHRQKAYLQQSSCLFGKMEQFIRFLKNEKLLKDTKVIIQGISGVNNFNQKISDNYINRFIDNRLVSMAIYDADKKHHISPKSFCSTNNIFSSYYLGDKDCENKANLKTHEDTINRLEKQINIWSKDFNKDYRKEFEKWYDNWQKINNDIPQISETLIEKISLSNVDKEETMENSKKAEASDTESLNITEEEPNAVGAELDKEMIAEEIVDNEKANATLKEEIKDNTENDKEQ